MPKTVLVDAVERIRRCPLAIANGHHYRADGSCLCELSLAAAPALGSTWPPSAIAWSRDLSAASMLGAAKADS